MTGYSFCCAGTGLHSESSVWVKVLLNDIERLNPSVGDGRLVSQNEAVASGIYGWIVMLHLAAGPLD